MTERLNRIPGIVCLEKREAVTQQSYYSFCFRLLNQNLFDNNAKIRQKLSTRIPIEFTSTYPALDDKSFFKPFLEKKYTRLWQFSKLDTCHQAHQEAVRFPHQYLLASNDQLEVIIDSIENVIQEMAQD